MPSRYVRLGGGHAIRLGRRHAIRLGRDGDCLRLGRLWLGRLQDGRLQDGRLQEGRLRLVALRLAVHQCPISIPTSGPWLGTGSFMSSQNTPRALTAWVKSENLTGFRT